MANMDDSIYPVQWVYTLILWPTWIYPVQWVLCIKHQLEFAYRAEGREFKSAIIVIIRNVLIASDVIL